MKVMVALMFLSSVLAAADRNAGAEILAKAASTGDLKTLQNLLSSGIDPDTPDKFGSTPLDNATALNQTKAVEVLLDSHADPNPPVRNHRDVPQPPSTPLQHAADLGNRRVAYLLIAAGARVDEKGPTGRTALHYATNNLELTQLLLNEGADVNARDEEGTSALDEAVWHGLLDTTAILLAHGARLNESEPRTGATPINEAAYRGNTNVVRYLLQFHPDLNTPDKNGFIPVQNAARMKKQQAAMLLLNAEAPQQLTPQFMAGMIESAVKNNEDDLLEVLINRGAAVDGILPSGSTPLDLAAISGAGRSADILLKKNANPNLDIPNGASPLEDASLKGFAAITGTLLEHGALMDQVNRASGTTALYSAASFGRLEVIKLLLAKGAAVNLCGKNRKTPYQVALENGYGDVATQTQAQGGTKTCSR